MKSILFFIYVTMYLSAASAATQIFDGFDDYYATLGGSLFKSKSTLVFSGLGKRGLRWKGHYINVKRSVAFPGDIATIDDLGRDPILYEHGSWACVEGQATSASGTAVRHFSVYVIDARRKEAVMLYRLSSLFATCMGLRMDRRGRFLFDHITYNYAQDAESPNGLTLAEYRIDGTKFDATGRKRFVKFTEADNVWKFTVGTGQ